ncbi:hypothetical protein VKT23_010244 [Stygiomarasmius scandens]|uniref:DUF6533 domain-containing protein n=1 Tax=Marasmiellus scandens TaxID=2682957 RepID=A0ABR1JH60_9AGAR
MTIINDIISTRYLSAAALALMAYDHLITLDQEITNVWLPYNRKKDSGLSIQIQDNVLLQQLRNGSGLFSGLGLGGTPRDEVGERSDSRRTIASWKSQISARLRRLGGLGSGPARYFNVHKLTFVLNRYLAEAISAYSMFVFSGSGKGSLDDAVR